MKGISAFVWAVAAVVVGLFLFGFVKGKKA